MTLAEITLGAPILRCRGITSDRSPNYAPGANARFWANVNDTKQRLPSCRTRREPCRPFESGSNCLPGMESFAKQVIQ